MVYPFNANGPLRFIRKLIIWARFIYLTSIWILHYSVVLIYCWALDLPSFLAVCASFSWLRCRLQRILQIYYVYFVVGYVVDCKEYSKYIMCIFYYIEEIKGERCVASQIWLINYRSVVLFFQNKPVTSTFFQNKSALATSHQLPAKRTNR
jgi:hypothetical protein